MNKPKLNGMQLLTAGTLLGKIIEETQKIKIAPGNITVIGSFLLHIQFIFKCGIQIFFE